MQVYLRHTEVVSIYQKLILTCLILFPSIVAQRHGVVHYSSHEYCLYYELQTWPSKERDQVIVASTEVLYN